MVPLSDHEQRLLEQMERALSAEDPKFATAMRGADLRRRYQRRAVLASLAFIVGVVLLMSGAVAQVIPLAIAGFVVMLGSAWYGLTSWRRVPAEGEIGTFPTAKGKGEGKGGGRSANRAGFMDRLEERWRRRREEGPGGRGR